MESSIEKSSEKSSDVTTSSITPLSPLAVGHFDSALASLAALETALRPVSQKLERAITVLAEKAEAAQNGRVVGRSLVIGEGEPITPILKRLREQNPMLLSPEPFNHKRKKLVVGVGVESAGGVVSIDKSEKVESDENSEKVEKVESVEKAEKNEEEDVEDVKENSNNKNTPSRSSSRLKAQVRESPRKPAAAAGGGSASPAKSAAARNLAVTPVRSANPRGFNNGTPRGLISSRNSPSRVVKSPSRVVNSPSRAATPRAVNSPRVVASRVATPAKGAHSPVKSPAASPSPSPAPALSPAMGTPTRRSRTSAASGAAKTPTRSVHPLKRQI